MKKQLTILGILLLVGSIGVVSAQIHIGEWVKGVEPCQITCFDLNKNPNTLGFDPIFLKQEQVKKTCREALSDGEKLPYCDVKLGTL